MTEPESAEQIQWRYVDSSNVFRVGWDRYRSMYVEFIDGSVYEYKGVSRQRAVACAYARSVGKYVTHVVRPRYPAIRVA